VLKNRGPGDSTTILKEKIACKAGVSKDDPVEFLSARTGASFETRRVRRRLRFDGKGGSR
jgi:hypothetical protein